MRKLLLLLMTVGLFTSCGKSKEEKLIADYVQTFSGAKMDLGFKMKKLEKVEEITAKDSLEFLKSHFEEQTQIRIETAESSIKHQNTLIELNESSIQASEDYLKTATREGSIKMYQENIENRKQEIEESKQKIDEYKTSIELYKDGKGFMVVPYLENVKSKIDSYEEQGDKVLVTKYLANFSAKNPMLNNMVQEITRYYFIDGEKTKILATENIN